MVFGMYVQSIKYKVVFAADVTAEHTRGVPRILVGGFLVVAKDTACKARGEIWQNHAH